MTLANESLIERLRHLKSQRRAVILAHNYQRPEVQDAADYVGDSLGLSRQAAGAAAEVILFCGVDFMAETAAILCPGRKVLVPDTHAGCPMANMLTVRELRALKAQHPAARVVCYVNSSAQVKAESDICCTSANAVQVVRSLPAASEIIFVPDRSLGEYAAKQAGRPLILWPGYCPTHHRIFAADILRARGEHPGAKVVVHPECTADVIELADHVASTTGILRFCQSSPAKEFIIGTETALLHRLEKENPRKSFYPASPLADCPNMKLNTLEKMVWSLEDMVYEVTVPEPIAGRARQAIQRMLAVRP
jgi:quinolinate synthase